MQVVSCPEISLLLHNQFLYACKSYEEICNNHLGTQIRKEMSPWSLITDVSMLLLLLLSHFSCVRLCVTPQTAAHQAPPCLGSSRQEHWSGFPFPSPMHESEKSKSSHSVVSSSSRPHGLQPTRLLCPWDFPGKSTGVGCHCIFQDVSIITHYSWILPKTSYPIVFGQQQDFLGFAMPPSSLNYHNEKNYIK